jgi:RNase adapter protein RapZ
VSELLVITGLSGAGRSEAADDLEDLGWFVIDNLPITLLDKVVELGQLGSEPGQRLAFVIGPTADHVDLLERIVALRRDDHRVRVLFLDASTSVLVKRYGSTRRRHPLDNGHGSITDAIERERLLLESVKAAADLVIDTTELTVHQLKARVGDAFAEGRLDEGMRVVVTSFGYKYGLPLDVDLVFDVRFLPNPHWVEALRPLTGLDDAVREFVFAQPATAEFLQRLQHLLELVLPAYAAEGKSYLNLAVGCTGGQHRSVALAEDLATWMRSAGLRPGVVHRDLPRRSN